MDVRGKRVLILGDSLSASPSSPGGQLGERLRAAGATVRVNGRVSRSAVNLFSGTNGEDGAAVLAAEAAARPEIVVVFLGTNDLGITPAKDAAGFRRIRGYFPQAEIWALGPPSFARLDLLGKTDAVYQTLRSVFGARVIDTRPLTVDLLAAPGRAADGVHFTAAGGRVLGERLAAAVLAADTRPRVAQSASAAIAARPWLPATLGGALGAAALIGLAVVVKRRRQLSGLGASATAYLPEDQRQYVHKNIADEVDGAVERAAAAGASGPLEYIGAGAEGIVFCAGDTAYKVGRPGRGGLEAEAAFFKKANQVPSIKQHIATFKTYDKEHDVLVRECVRPSERDGRPRRVQDSEAFDIASRIADVMKPYGFRAPERKGDSYIFVRGRGPVLVDGGFALRHGNELVKHALDVVNGRVKLRGAWEIESLAHEIRAERGQTIPPKVADKILRRLGTEDQLRTWGVLDGAKMGTKRVAPGYYTGTYRGRDFDLVKVAGHSNWYWRIPATDAGGEDWHASKRDALEAVKEWIDMQPEQAEAAEPLDGAKPYASFEDFRERLDEVSERPTFFQGGAAKVNEAAAAIAAEGGAWDPAGRKVFIADVAKRLGSTPERLAGLLLVAQNQGWVTLARADLVGAMDPAKVAASEIEPPEGRGSYHFVVVEPPRAEEPGWERKPRARARGKVGGGVAGPASKRRGPAIRVFQEPGLLPRDPAYNALRWDVTGEDQIIGVELEWKGDPTRYALAHPATSGGKKWQVTWFDALGPMGDVRRDKLVDALADGADPYTYRVTKIHTKSGVKTP